MKRLDTYKLFENKQNIAERLSKKLLKAVQHKNVSHIETLIDMGADVNYQSDGGETPLMYCYNNHNCYDVVKLLISKGAKLDITDYEKNTALMYLVNNGKFNEAELLINAGADMTLTDKYGFNFINQAHFSFTVTWFNLERIQRLIFSKAPSLIKTYIDNDYGLIIRPEIKNDPEFAHLFTGYDLNLLENKNLQEPKSNLTPDELGKMLYDAVDKMDNPLERMHYCIRQGANINYNKKSYANFTPLMEAALQEKIEALKLLIEAGADLNVRDEFGRTALIIGSPRAKTILIKAGANMRIKDNSGQNFITNRSYNGTLWLIEYNTQKLILDTDPSMVRYLVDDGIIIDRKIKKEFAHLFTGTDLNLL